MSCAASGCLIAREGDRIRARLIGDFVVSEFLSLRLLRLLPTMIAICRLLIPICLLKHQVVPNHAHGSLRKAKRE